MILVVLASSLLWIFGQVRHSLFKVEDKAVKDSHEYSTDDSMQKYTSFNRI